MLDKLTEFLQFVNLIFTLLRDGFYLMENHETRTGGLVTFDLSHISRNLQRNRRTTADWAERDLPGVSLPWLPPIQTFKSASAGSWALTIWRIFLTAARRLCAPNKVVPLTNVSAPARAHSAAVWKLMPPSTSMR